MLALGAAVGYEVCVSNLTPRTFSVPDELDGERLDRVLVALLEDVSRTRVQELIQDGGVRIDGEPPERMSTRVEAGATIELLDVARSRVRYGGVDEAGEAPLVIVHEDEHVIVIDKPAGMVSHPSSVVRGGTLSERAVARFGPLPAPQGEDRPGVVHRLDADTSGLIVLGRSEAAATELVRMFRDRDVAKRYLAIVFGVPRFDTDWIDSAIGRAPGRPDRMSVVDGGQGREALTYYETRERFDGFGYVECKPTTGRTHQLRVHLSSIEHPLVGDRVYRGRRGLRRNIPRGAPPMTRHALHASGLAFAHPVTGERLEFEAPLAADMEAWLVFLREREQRLSAGES